MNVDLLSRGIAVAVGILMIIFRKRLASQLIRFQNERFWKSFNDEDLRSVSITEALVGVALIILALIA